LAIANSNVEAVSGSLFRSRKMLILICRVSQTRVARRRQVLEEGKDDLASKERNLPEAKKKGNKDL
jgi:hypothetical protein